VSLGTIVAVIAEAERRALAWMATHAPPTSRALALDEIYGRKRRGAYLNVVDLDSWAVWAAEGPLPVDAETWTLVLWEAQDRGLRWHATVSDGAPAMQQASIPMGSTAVMSGICCIPVVRSRGEWIGW
jgi:hypothetical protein